MNPEHVVSLELAKKLKEAGWLKETEFWWIEFYNSSSSQPKRYFSNIISTSEWERDEYEEKEYLKMLKRFPAPLTSEIGKRLPHEVIRYTQAGKPKSCLIRFWKLAYKFCASVGEWDDVELLRLEFDADTEANLRAKMWLYLKQNNLLGERGEDDGKT